MKDVILMGTPKGITGAMPPGTLWHRFLTLVHTFAVRPLDST